ALVTVDRAELLERFGHRVAVVDALSVGEGFAELSDGHVGLSVAELQVRGVEPHAHALARRVRWQPREDIVERRECFVRLAAQLLDQARLPLDAGMRHDVAGSVYGHGFAVRDKSLVVTAGHAVDVADGLISIGARGWIRGASLDRASEVVERFRVRVQPLSAVTGASEPSDGLRVVITAAVVERQGVDELVDALAEQVGVRVANGDVRSPTMGDQLRPVGDLLDQRVAEGIRRLGDLDSEHEVLPLERPEREQDRKSTRLNSSHVAISYAVFCLKKKKERIIV